MKQLWYIVLFLLNFYFHLKENYEWHVFMLNDKKFTQVISVNVVIYIKNSDFEIWKKNFGKKSNEFQSLIFDSIII